MINSVRRKGGQSTLAAWCVKKSLDKLSSWFYWTFFNLIRFCFSSCGCHYISTVKIRSVDCLGSCNMCSPLVIGIFANVVGGRIHPCLTPVWTMELTGLSLLWITWLMKPLQGIFMMLTTFAGIYHNENFFMALVCVRCQMIFRNLCSLSIA